MKRTIIVALIATVTSLCANAQMPYDVSVSKASYVPLDSAYKLSGTSVWDEETYHIDIPFSFKLNGKSISRIFLQGSEMMYSDTAGIVDGFAIVAADLIDRGILDSALLSRSPLSYKLEGPVNDRVLKIELANVGFADELWLETIDDYMNIQVWFYEKDDVIELRYGKSSVVDFASYFPLGFFTGFVKNIDQSQSTFDILYILSGDPAAPTIDSFIQDGFSMGLNTIPDSGAVYRFTPKKTTTTGVNDVQYLQNIRIYPTVSASQISIDNPYDYAVTYKMLSLNGSTLSMGSVSPGRNIVNIENYPGGLYIMRLEYQSNHMAVKLIKQ
ncbi:MAG TPA: T9SS type A sorting domain-containing protein [Flavipsychrobacter sp.]